MSVSVVWVVTPWNLVGGPSTLTGLHGVTSNKTSVHNYMMRGLFEKQISR
jgi:hypothetical protein